MPTEPRKPDVKFLTTAEILRELKARSVFVVEGDEDQLARIVPPVLEPGIRYAVCVVRKK